jgi:hypothetical protein
MRPSDWCPMPRHRRPLVLPFLATVTALVGAACRSTTKKTSSSACSSLAATCPGEWTPTERGDGRTRRAHWRSGARLLTRDIPWGGSAPASGTIDLWRATNTVHVSQVGHQGLLRSVGRDYPAEQFPLQKSA